jgi:polyisoprenoid-binding protein YceI
VWEITGLPEPLQRTVLGIPVRNLRCGNPRMDRDLYRAMRADDHPLMTFRLYTYHTLSPTGATAFMVKAVGTLGLAGRENVVMVDARVERLPDGRVRLRGSKALRMTDFGIEPPTAMLGLVRARDKIVVRFDFVADPSAGIRNAETPR